MNLLLEAAVFLTAAVIAVPLSRRSGFGAVLGYLAAGVVIGPWGLGLVTGVDNIFHFSEIGVVLLMFIIGLELQPSRLWVLRKSVFGLGSLQVLATGAALAGTAMALGLPLRTAIIAGLGLSLSSTAFALQMLAEKKQLTTRHGRTAFSILLFQDLAVIPLLALLRLMSTSGIESAHTGNMITTGGLLVAVIGGLVLGGRYLLRPVLRVVAAAGSREISTAASLLVVIGAALLMEQVGLSMALGAFLAGVVLADSEFRHEFEANIEPFKGLLLGLFFIAVGMSANVGLVLHQPLRVAALVTGLLLIKFLVLYALGAAQRMEGQSRRALALALPQGGEFAFVLFSAAAGYGVMEPNLSQLLIVVVTVSMAATPLLVLANERLLEPWLSGRRAPAQFDRIEETEHAVIIAGFGRFGQIVGRLLRVKKIPFTALEINPQQVDVVRRFGNKVYYGDASRLELLQAAHADRAKIFVLAIDDVEASLKTVLVVRRHFPHLSIYARARNRYHAHLLMNLGVKSILRETFLSSLELGGQVLRALGEDANTVMQELRTFRAHDEATLKRQFAVFRDREKLIQSSQEAAQELEHLFEQDTTPIADDRTVREKG